MRFTREFYTPKEYNELIEKQGASVYLIDQPKIRAMGFSGRRQKPDFHYSFKDEPSRQTYLKRYFEGLQASIKSKSEMSQTRADHAATFLKGLVPGAILYASWGYDQTNVDFYKVVARKGKNMVQIQELALVTVPGSEGMMCDKVMPGEPLQKPAVWKSVRGACIRMDSSTRLHLHDGRPQYRSWYA